MSRIVSHYTVGIFLLLASFFATIFSDNGANLVTDQINDCDTVKCEDIQFCSPGLQWVPANKNLNICCNACEPNVGLGGNCTYNYASPRSCSGSLKCQSTDPNNFQPNVPYTCVYQWENNYPVNCSRPGCPTYCSCPDDQLLVKADGVTNCCDQCIFLSKLGDYCDEKQKCISELKCDENKCLESSKCDGVDCGTVIRSCPENSYHVPRNGIDTCCDICKPYAKPNEPCGDQQQCGFKSYCNYSNKTCVAYPALDCSLIQCSPVAYCNGQVIPADGVNNCCEYCAIAIDRK